VTPETAARVSRIVARHLALPVGEVGADTELKALGLDSLGALQLAFDIEEEFEVSVPDDRIAEFTTVRAICEGIDALRSAGAR
jgi:acyl carrier protein